MNKFIKTILLFALLFFAIEKIFYVFLYVSPGLEKDQRLELLINGKINKEVLIFGSSHGARDIIAHQIQDSMRLSAYNLSYPGSDIEFHEFLLRTVLKFNKKPKMIMLAVDETAEFLPNEALIFRLDRMYPLAKYDYINEEMIKRGEKNFLSKFLVLGRINKSNLDIREKHFTEMDTLLPCGSMPISFQRNRPFSYDAMPARYPKEKEEVRKITAFLKFQDLCIKNNIKLAIVFSPNFKKHDPDFEKRIRQLSGPKVMCFIYDRSNPIYKDKSFYHDEAHLQKNGATIFTNEIIGFLKQKL
jgi:hypothetical protein